MRGRGGREALVPPEPAWMGADNPLNLIAREIAVMKKLDHPNVSCPLSLSCSLLASPLTDVFRLVLRS